jgi:hypothetical protein
MSDISDVKSGLTKTSETHKSGRDDDPLGFATTGQLISTVENFDSHLDHKVEDAIWLSGRNIVGADDHRAGTQDNATNIDKHCEYRLLPYQQRVVEGDGLSHDAGKCKSLLFAARVFAKAVAILICLASTQVMRNYAVSRSLSSPVGDKWCWGWISGSRKVCASTTLASDECSLTEFSTHSENPTGLQSPIHCCY